MVDRSVEDPPASARSGETSDRPAETEPLRLLLAGPPGCGKTTAVVRIVEGLEGSGRPIRGIVTEEIRDRGRRIGFSILGLRGGRDAVMAHADFEEGPRVSRYRVDVGAVDRVVAEELEGVPEDAVVVIDEIGKMECFSEAFTAAARAALDSDVPVLATIAATGGGFIAQVRAREDVELVWVASENRDGLPDRIATRLLR